MRRRDIIRGAAVSALAATTSMPGSRVRAEDAYPARPIRLIVPFAAGGLEDSTARVWAETVKSGLNGTLFIDNRPGAGGTIGAGEAAHAAADGYNLLLGSTTTLVLNPALMPQISYDPLKDFAAISIFALATATIAVHPSVPAHDLAALIGYIKAHPGTLSYGSAGTGSNSHLAGEMFKYLAGGLDLTHISYKGGSPAISDLVGGHIPVATPHMTAQLLSLHNDGKVRVLAVTARTRLGAAPGIPTAIEAGLPGLIATTFNGILAPAGTPAAIVDRLGTAAQHVIANAGFRKSLADAGFEPVDGTGGAAAQRYIADETVRLKPIMKAVDFKLG
jgi:tripartite-type tricarboxylate transporter receptor subunit TctC